MSGPLYGAIEAGGTKFVCAAAYGFDSIIAQTRIETADPAPTLQAVERFFAGVEARLGAFRSLGIATFGPVDLRPGSPTFGRILATPKRGWASVDLLGPIAARFRCPVAIDTDVNAAASAEALHGAGRGCGTVVYVTVGTGIGAGAVVEGRTLRGMLHPEMGHVRVLRDERDRGFAGVCPFHGDCLEGLASGTAIRARYGASLDQLPSEHEAPELIGYYLGQLVANIILTLSAERIVFGGGVMSHAMLLRFIRQSALRVLNGYPSVGADAASLERIVVAPALGERSGLVGAIRLAEAAAGSRPHGIRHS
jgi:fructokinase